MERKSRLSHDESLAQDLAMKLFDTPRAPNPRRVRIFLAEKGIAVPAVQIDIMKLEQFSQAFGAVNPFQRVPVLVLDDGTAISESVAICRYFEELQPEPVLFGRTALEKALVEMWQRRVELNLFQHVANVFRHSHPAMAPLETPQIPALAEASRPRVEAALRLLDAHLGDHEYLAGPAYSIADITCLVAIDFMKPGRLRVPDGLVHLTRWYAAVSARPGSVA